MEFLPQRLSAIFAWFIARPRQWLTDNPVELVIRYKKKHTVTTPERLSVASCRELMAFLEKEHPEWVCFFAVALFAGVRPDMTDGEMAKFALKVAAHGADKIYRGGKFHLTADMTKDGRARRDDEVSRRAGLEPAWCFLLVTFPD